MSRSKIISLLVLSTFLLLKAAPDKSLQIPELQPEPQHQRVVQKVTQILTQLHYKDVSIDDSLSSQLYNNYIEFLDYNRSYFTAIDINKFKKYRYEFDTFLQTGNLDPVFMIFNTFQKRMNDRLKFVDERIDKPFDFTIDEYYEPFRDSTDWAADMTELDDFWRKRIKSEYLSLKISGKEESKIKETLHTRYSNLQRRLSQNQSEDVIQIYLNALAKVFDPHTDYFSPKATDDFNIRMRQSLEGIGARLQTDNEYTKVVEIIPGGPADKSGLLKANDLIVGVGQENEDELTDVIGWRIDDVVQLIRGPKDSKVNLQILHDETDLLTDAETITIKRDKVKLEDSAAKSDTLIIKRKERDLNIGVIEIPAFYFDFDGQRSGDANYKSTTRDVTKILNDFKKQNLDGVVIDLRKNGGGFLSEAVNLTGLFIKNGPVVQVKDVRGEIKTEADFDPSVLYDGPLVVLVDQFSASASEIFAAAIQDYDRGIIVGSQTYGKGTVQAIYDLNHFFPRSSKKYGQVKLTNAKFYRVNGGSTQHKGVIPDVELPSRFDHDEFGESSQPNALLWDQISEVKHNHYVNNLDNYIKRLKENHQVRMTKDENFAYVVNEINEFRDKKQEKRYSLNEAKRLEDKENNKKKDRDEFDQKEEDVMLRESGNILADYIQISEKK
ncbi:MAG: carboxy terminal-processing peptidase [Calditrichae bacterium]|nr:carboxy terminal-processing peptidase [Calditrichota bacterium]MCB9058090.1 carboxy terminal-processing peptidase [Calditrichia bacterium]